MICFGGGSYASNATYLFQVKNAEMGPGIYVLKTFFPTSRRVKEGVAVIISDEGGIRSHACRAHWISRSNALITQLPRRDTTYRKRVLKRESSAISSKRS